MKPSHTLLIFFAALFSAMPVAFASSLPACPSDTSAYWHNCFGIWINGGHKYFGEYRDSKADGQGIYTYANGVKDIGTFKDDTLNGYAVRYDADGTILKQGIWKDDEFQYAQNSSDKLTSRQNRSPYAKKSLRKKGALIHPLDTMNQNDAANHSRVIKKGLHQEIFLENSEWFQRYRRHHPAQFRT